MRSASEGRRDSCITKILLFYRIAAAALFFGDGSPLFAVAGAPGLSARSTSPTFANWRFGYIPDSSGTFVASLSAMGLGVGFALSAFRFILFREPEIRRLDFILVLFQASYMFYVEGRLPRPPRDSHFIGLLSLQIHNLLFYALRACMSLPTSSGILASVRESVRGCNRLVVWKA